MADILLDVQSPPSTPAAGQAVIYVDNVSKIPAVKDDAGKVFTLGELTNFSVAAQGAGFASDTYLTGSNVKIPRSGARVGTLYRCSFDVSKTAAGVAAPVIIVRFGTAGAIGDTARLTFTFSAQTAAADVGRVEVVVLFRAVSGVGVIQGRATLNHTGGATGLLGLSVSPGPTLQVTSAAFDNTVQDSFVGLSVNGGASAAWTVQLVESELKNV